METLPRIITVDPSGIVGRVVAGMLPLLNRTASHIDVPFGATALAEIERGGADLLVTAWGLSDDMNGLLLALEVRRAAPRVPVILLAGDDAPQQLDEETSGESPFLFLHRNTDAARFMWAVQAALRGEDIFAAASSTVTTAVVQSVDHGPVPMIDSSNAGRILSELLRETGAIAVILSTRLGEVVIETGAVGYLDRTQLATALMPLMLTTLDIRSIVGNQPQSLHFYDGDDKDVFVFTVGVHHFLCAVFDGQAGQRQFGLVNRYGRRAVQDLVALIGTSALVMQAPVAPKPKPSYGTASTAKPQVTLEAAPILERPEFVLPEPEQMRLDPIANLDFSIFDQLAQMDSDSADDLFDPEKLAQMVSRGNPRAVSFEDAIELGVLPDFSQGNGDGKHR